jgi:hypothetical protein
VIVTTLAEETVMDNMMYVKLVKERVAILEIVSTKIRCESMLATFETEAVKTTTS